jgi:hypothetical protein
LCLFLNIPGQWFPEFVPNTTGDLKNISEDYQYHCWISYIGKFSLHLGGRWFTKHRAEISSIGMA